MAAGEALADPRAAGRRHARRLIALAHAAYHGQPERLQDALGHPSPLGSPGPGQGQGIRWAACQSRHLTEPRRRWEPRRAAAGRTLSWPQSLSPEPGEQVPGREVPLDSPGSGAASPPAGEVSDHLEPPGSRLAPRRPGERERLVAYRLACDRHLAEAVQPWAFGSIGRSAWARERSDTFCALGDRWLEVRWHGRSRGLPEDQTVHVANRNRRLGTRPDPPTIAPRLVVDIGCLTPATSAWVTTGAIIGSPAWLQEPAWEGRALTQARDGQPHEPGCPPEPVAAAPHSRWAALAATDPQRASTSASISIPTMVCSRARSRSG